MNAFRSNQIGLAALTLAIQLSSVIVLAVGFCCDSPREEAPKQKTMACHQTGDHAMCPMMKHHTNRTDSSVPAMRSCCDPHIQALLALIGTVGLLPSLSSPSLVFNQAGIVVTLEYALPDWISPVDLPPPRA